MAEKDGSTAVETDEVAIRKHLRRVLTFELDDGGDYLGEELCLFGLLYVLAFGDKWRVDCLMAKVFSRVIIFFVRVEVVSARGFEGSRVLEICCLTLVGWPWEESSSSPDVVAFLELCDWELDCFLTFMEEALLRCLFFYFFFSC